MLKEKLVYYNFPPAEVYEGLLKGWLTEGFEQRMVDQEKGTLICTGKAGYRVRVDVFMSCIPEGEGTVVQMIYSPILTPGISRPVNISRVAQDEVMADLEARMNTVLADIGKWQAVNAEGIQDHPERLEDPFNLRVLSRKKTLVRQLWFGFSLIAVGVLMLYLVVSEALVIGSYTLWMIVAVVGIITFCAGLFRLVWRR